MWVVEWKVTERNIRKKNSSFSLKESLVEESSEQTK